ncbi:MAG: cell division protein ZapA [Treponema sp.]|nr:cell division protein ZapA [Treponema sp.]MBR4005743.1 cell division protein ZapA [Treponema sp.]
MGRLQVDLLGASFSVRSGEDDKYLSKLLSHYKEIVSSLRKSGASDDPLQLSILAGITLADELYKAREQNASIQVSPQDQDEAERLTMQMIEKIDKVL